jgi:archaellum component FlaF (FlaF/FlaG flagellin family)
VATISEQGIATGISPGQASITALLAGVVSNTSTLTVSTATIVSIAVIPNPASGPTGTEEQFKAVGTFDDGSTIDLSTEATWTSSDVAVATINTSGTASIAGKSGQTATIKATITQNGVTVSDQSTLTVLVAQPGFVITSPPEGSVINPGQAVTITWTGGVPTWSVDVYLIELTPGSPFAAVAVPASDVPNSGTLTNWPFPSHIDYGTFHYSTCGHTYQFLVQEVSQITWTYGPHFTVACQGS